VIIPFSDPVFPNMKWLVKGSGTGGTRYTPIRPATCMFYNACLMGGQLETVKMETGNGKWKWSKPDANEC